MRINVRATILTAFEPGDTVSEFVVECDNEQINESLKDDQVYEEDMMISICATALAAILMEKQKRGGQKALDSLEHFTEKVIKMIELYKGSDPYVNPNKN